MKIKLDENMPLALVGRLSALGHDVHTVPGENLVGGPDDIIWQACQQEHRFLVTQDLDFSDLRRFRPGTHAGLLLVRLREPSRRRLSERVWQLFLDERAEQWTGCFVVATETKIRVSRAKNV